MTITSDFQGIVLSGSGLLYPIHLGFLRALIEKKNDNVKNLKAISGVSGGAFCAFLFLMCRSTGRFEEAVAKFLQADLHQLLESPSLKTFLFEYGCFRTEQLENYFDDVKFS